MADEDMFVLMIKRNEEEDPVKREEEEEGNKEVAVVHELSEFKKLNMVEATTTTPTNKKRGNVDILKIIRDEANDLQKRVEILTFNNVEDAVENQMEYPREISFMVVEQVFSSEILRVLKIPELRFIPCIIFSHSTVAVVRRFIWNDGKSKSKQCTVGIIRDFMEGNGSPKFADMRRIAATKLDDALSTTEKTSSEEEEEEEPGDGEFDDDDDDDGDEESQRGTRRRFF